MKQLCLAMCVLFAFITSVYAGDIYICIDRDDNTIMTSSPQDGMRDCVLKGSSESSTSKSSRGYTKSERGENITISQIDEILADLDRKSNEMKEDFISDSQGKLQKVWVKRGLKKEERRQQTDLLNLKARLSTGGAVSYDDRSSQKQRQLDDMEDAIQQQNAQILHQNAQIQRMQHQNRMKQIYGR